MALMGGRRCIQNFCGELEEKGPIGRPSSEWKLDIKTDLKKV
jgi:hypothetical protein